MIIEGIAHWASIKVPNSTFEPVTYQLTLVPSDEDACAKFANEGYKLKKIDEQGALFFRKYYNRPDGSTNPPPRLVDGAKNPLDVAVGNGSKVRVQYQPRVINNHYGKFHWLELQAVQVLDLIEFNDGNVDEFDVEEGSDDIEF